jgi:DNA-binding CsgD family transcriptional regulator
MRRVNFILAIDSYLVRKGVAAVLHRIPGASVLREIDSIDVLTRYLEQHGTDFLIISDALFAKATDLYVHDPSLLERTILLQQDQDTAGRGERIREIIYLSEGKEAITGKIDELLNPYFRDCLDHTHFALTERERTIIRLISMGLTNRQIAEKLFLSTHTVITHRKHIIQKLGIKSVSGLTVYAIVNNIITIDEVTLKHEQ